MSACFDDNDFSDASSEDVSLPNIPSVGRRRGKPFKSTPPEGSAITPDSKDKRKGRCGPVLSREFDGQRSDLRRQNSGIHKSAILGSRLDPVTISEFDSPVSATDVFSLKNSKSQSTSRKDMERIPPTVELRGNLSHEFMSPSRSRKVSSQTLHDLMKRPLGGRSVLTRTSHEFMNTSVRRMVTDEPHVDPLIRAFPSGRRTFSRTSDAKENDTFQGRGPVKLSDTFERMSLIRF
jgi:hypothetical protein